MKKFIFIILAACLSLIIFLFFFLFFFSRQTHQSFNYWPETFISALKVSPAPALDFLILGVDPRHDQLEKTVTSDTIIYSRLDTKFSRIHLFPLPRDLWNFSTKSKINDIYPQSLKFSDPQQKFEFINQNFSEITGQKITKTIIFTTQDLKTFADLLGGVDVYLDKGFTDPHYPNPDYIAHPSSDTPVYKTVSFPSGWVHLDSRNISEFVRSRKSADTAALGGTDIGRIERQQLLVEALLNRSRQELTRRPWLIISFYNFWQKLEHNFTDSELISWLLHYPGLSQAQLIRHSIDTGEDSTHLLYHPQRFHYPQWVFLPQGGDFRSLHDYIAATLLEK